MPKYGYVLCFVFVCVFVCVYVYVCVCMCIGHHRLGNVLRATQMNMVKVQ